MPIYNFFLTPALSARKLQNKRQLVNNKLKANSVQTLDSEFCFYIETKNELTVPEKDKLSWILAPTFGGNLTEESVLSKKGETDNDKSKIVVEIGPRLNFSTAFSTNAVSICNSVTIPASRVERSVRYLVGLASECDAATEDIIVGLLYDKMTECRYLTPITSFFIERNPESWTEIDVIQKGALAMEAASNNLGLAFDGDDLSYYTQLFIDVFKRNPTTVEAFDLAQSNSEHSRHWFFKGRMNIDGFELNDSLFDMIMKTQSYSNQNNVIQFCDNSSAIQGFDTRLFLPADTDEPSYFKVKTGTRHIIFTAETHNFPTGVAPFSGATTGTGGRIRDVHAAGRGAHVIAGTAGYSFGNLNIPGYTLPWEDDFFEYPSNFALPVDVAVEASNGASDYGNKFGEPIICGFARSFGMTLPNKDRVEYVKPIMFTGGIGSIGKSQTQKLPAKKDMAVVKIGGPVYRIGVGGGAASSVSVQGDQREELDFGAVQRGDPEMEQKLNRVIRACVERGKKNIICSIHDQGAGGNGNVLKEIVDPAGAIIYASQFQLGDPTITTLELWGAEYQESDAILVLPQDKPILQRIGNREKCPISFVGEVTGDGRIVLVEAANSSRHPVDLELKHILGQMPRKTFRLKTEPIMLKPLELPENLTLKLALERVLRLPSVASKRYLTSKVDRSVTGLVAQQQCVGPLQIPLADVSVIALSFYDIVGSATSIGEQPIKGLVNPAAGGRMSVAEAITNLVFAKITCLSDVKCSGNWMWAAKLPGEGAALHEACHAMCEVMKMLGIAVDGGKDSLSMAARVHDKIVKSPGTLVISTYAPCPDIRLTVTPDLKCPNNQGILLYVDISDGKSRLGGTAFAHCYKQLGNESPDLEKPYLLRDAFNVTQDLITKGFIAAGHDVSDGGFISCVLEMAFAGNCGIEIILKNSQPLLNYMFAEEVGWILEVPESIANYVVASYKQYAVNCQIIGVSSGIGADAIISIQYNEEVVLKEPMTALRDMWEETSFQLELRQTNPDCVLKEKQGLSLCKAPPYSVPFDFATIISRDNFSVGGPRVAVIREEGINGDREMCASLYMAGFEVWDVTMTDLLLGHITLEKFRGVVFPGGFSYADVLGAAKGWAACLLFHPELVAQFTAFRDRPNTFSLGVCNGCQLMAQLGWVIPDIDKEKKITPGVSLQQNVSERFESRFSTVKIAESPSIMLAGMADCVLGVWVAHGEGRFVFKTDKLLLDTQSENLVPIVYVDDNGSPTVDYPFNPNGSVGGIAAVCSKDGRHLAMMPHPERTVLPWQWPWMPPEWYETMSKSPWLKLFSNAFQWCCVR